MKTKNLAVMLTDIKGFTSKTAGFSRMQTQELLSSHRDLVLPVILSFNGRLVKTIGDAFLVVFDSPTDAVLCGVEVQDILREYNAGKGPGDKIEIRIAINSGEVAVHDDGDIYGDAVNITSRLESIAEVGEVFFTEAVYLAMNKKEVPSSEVGYRQFKGVAEKIKVYRVLREVPVGSLGGEAPPAVPAGSGPSPAPSPCAPAGFPRRAAAILVDAAVFAVILSVLGLIARPSLNWSREETVNDKVIKKISVGSGGVALVNDAGEDPYLTFTGTVAFSAAGARILKPGGGTIALGKAASAKARSFDLNSGPGAPAPFRSGVFVKGEDGASYYIARKRGVLTAASPHPLPTTRVAAKKGFRFGLTGSGEKNTLKMLLWTLYCALLVWRFGATPGKMLLKLTVVDASTGEKPAADKAFLRAFFSLVSLAVLLLGYVWALWDKESRTWHDLAAGTRVRKI